jgi:hypothetical protein
MGRGIYWEDEWEEVEGPVVRDWGTRMVAEEWSIGVQGLVKERRVTGR